MDDGKKPDASTWRDILASSRDILVIAGIYLYFTGYTYRYYYFDAFHLRGGIADASPYIVFVESYSVFRTNAWLFVAIVLLVASSALATALVPERLQKNARRFAWLVSVSGALALFPLLNHLAWQTAIAEARYTRDAARMGQDTGLVLAEKRKNVYPAEFLAAADTDRFHLLSRTDTVSYFLLQPRDARATPEVFIVPNADIGSLHEDLGRFK